MPELFFGEFTERSNHIYPQDTVTAIRPTGNFSGTVTEAWEENRPSSIFPKLVRMLDNAIRVESVDAKTRERMIESFTMLETKLAQVKANEAGKRNQGLLATGVGAAIAIVPIILAESPFPPLAIATAISGVALAVFGGSYSYRHHKAGSQAGIDAAEAHHRRDDWQDPISRLQQQRREAGLTFVTPHRNGWSGSLVHPDELADLWIRDFSTQRHETRMLVDVAGQTAFVEKTFSIGLLSRKAFSDISNVVDKRGGITLNDGTTLDPATVANMVESYEGYQAAYQRLNRRVDSAINQIQSSRNRAICALEEQLERWLIPAQLTRDSALSTARHQYELSLAPYKMARDEAIAEIERNYHYTPTDPFDLDQQRHKDELSSLRYREIANIRRQYKNDPAVLQIKHNWEDQQRWVDFLYNQAAEPVHHWFDQQQEAVRQQAKTRIAQVERRREEEIHRFFQPLSRLLINAATVGIHQPLGNFSWTDWYPHTREPSFNHFYMAPPAYRPDFRGQVSEALWNLFMGNEGVYGFASRPPEQFTHCQPDFGTRWPCEPQRAPVGTKLKCHYRPQQPVPPPPTRHPQHATAGTRRR